MNTLMQKQDIIRVKRRGTLMIFPLLMFLIYWFRAKLKFLHLQINKF